MDDEIRLHLSKIVSNPSNFSHDYPVLTPDSPCKLRAYTTPHASLSPASCVLTRLLTHHSPLPVARSQDESYQADAISSMMTLDQSYFETMHTFRLEWQPGKNGYVHW